MNNHIKIAVVGPESTGKSTISKQLANHFDSIAIPEYARYYCQNLNNQYTLQDEVNMYYGQLALEEALLPVVKSHLVICDTTIMTIKIWADHLFGDTPVEVKEEIRRRHYDLYLLMDIDLPWQDDVLRDFPEDREHFLEVWKRELSAIDAKVVLISGSGEMRVKNAIDAINKFIK